MPSVAHVWPGVEAHPEPMERREGVPSLVAWPWWWCSESALDPTVPPMPTPTPPQVLLFDGANGKKRGKMELSKKVHGEHNITTNAKQISPYNTFSLFYIHSVWVIGVMRNRLN